MARFRDNPIVEFQRELKECTRQSKFYDPPRDFILTSRLLEWLRQRPEVDDSSARATRILATVYGGREPFIGAWKYFDERMDEVQDQCWLKLLVILLQMHDDGSFARYLHKFHQAGYWDLKLSTVCHQPEELLKIINSTNYFEVGHDHDAVKWFIRLAQQLLTQEAITMDHEHGLEQQIILPITAKDSIGSGGQSNVFRIEVPLECISRDLVSHLTRLRRKAIRDEDYPDGKSLYYEFALKKIAEKKDWDREVRAHRALSASQMEGVVQCLGSWEVQTGTDPEYYLLMEFGWSDLNQHFWSVPPSIAQHIHDFWRSLSSVISALSNIHDLTISSPRSTTVSYYGWHGDIKPANILICDDGIKLTDPGWAQIVSQEEAEKDENGLPVVCLRGGTGSYGGPERIDQRTGQQDDSRPVTQRFDIWSLACVFLEAATWVILGARGVEQFRIARKMAHNKKGNSDDIIGDDCFHNRGDASFVTGDWIDYLKRGLRAEDYISGQILDIIKIEMLLVQPHRRITSQVLARRVDGALRFCEDAISKSPGYHFPPHLDSAFNREQEIAAKAWRNPQSRASSVRPMLDRSIKFGHIRGPLINHSDWQSATGPRATRLHVDLPPDPVVHTDPSRYGSQNQYSVHQNIESPQYTHPVQSIPWESAAGTAQPRTRSHVRIHSHDSTSTSPAIQEETDPKFGFYDALELIRSRGWVYSSLLEYPESRMKPGDSDEYKPSRGDTRGKDPGRRPNTFAISRAKSVKKGERTGGYTSALSQAFHYVLPRKSGKNGDSRVAPVSNKRPSAEPVQVKDTSFTQFFEDRDIIILVDNSSTMERHWPQVQNILPLLMAMLWGQDDDGIDIFSTSSTVPYQKLMEPWQAIEMLREKDPKCRKSRALPLGSASTSTDNKDPDDIYKVLSHIMENIGRGEKYRQRATILILTDGVWPKADPKVVAGAISTWLHRMTSDNNPVKDAVLKERYYSIQFIQFGDDPAGTQALEYLDDHLAAAHHVPDVIDVEPANGNVLKMIMGSLDDRWDEKAQSSVGEPSRTAEASTPNPESSTNTPAPLPSQYLNQRRGARSTWNSETRPTGTIYEEPEENYTLQQTWPPPQEHERYAPAVPHGSTSYPSPSAGPAFAQHPGRGPQQPQRRSTRQSSGHENPSYWVGSPVMPQRRKGTGL